MPDNTDVLASYIRADVAAAAPQPERPPPTISVRVNGVVTMELTLPPRLGRSRFMRRVILFILLILAFPASAAPATLTVRQAEAEARSFLPRCPSRDKDTRLGCEITQGNFIEEYVRALAGRSEAAGSTAMSFSVVHRDPVLDLGGPANQVLACAWALVWVLEDRSGDPGKRQYARDYCSVLPRAQRDAAATRALSIRQRILLHPVRLAPR